MIKKPITFLKLLFFGPDKMDSSEKKQGWCRAKELLAEEWNKPTYGIVRLTALFLLLLNFISPTVLVDCVIRSTKKRVITCSREAFYFIRAILFVVALLVPVHKSTLAVIFVIYFGSSILFSLAGGAFVWGQHSLNSQRTLLLALLNYFELTCAFAFLYIYYDAFGTSTLSVSGALYLSLMTATSLGYGDPGLNHSGKVIVALQITVFVVFLLLFLTIFSSRLSDEKKATL